MSLDLLKEIDNLEEYSIENINTYIHKEHRFALPILNYCQTNEILPKPCNVILFDAHHDSAPLINRDEFLRNATEEYSDEEFIILCKEHLCKNDDDWVTAGFELGIIGDIIIFGVNQNFDAHPDNLYVDANGVNHKIFLLPSFPIDELHSRGWLCDIAKISENKEFMDIIDWGNVEGVGLNFINDSKNLALIIDLDCFAIDWKDVLFPWPDELFQAKFSESIGTLEWSGQKFMEELQKKLGIITIAREPTYCGSEKYSDIILSKVCKFIFNDKLVI